MKKTFIFILLGLPLLIEARDETESLNKILQASITPGGLHEDRLEQLLNTWPGIRTLDGVAAVYDLWFQSPQDERISACRYIQQHFEVPLDQIAGFLIERAKQNFAEPLALEDYLIFMRDYGDDPRVPRYYTSLLDDKRRLKLKVIPPDHDQIGSTARVCDAARLELDRWLEKRGLIKFGDPGNAASALFDPDRDQNIHDIKPVLIKTGIMEAPKPPEEKPSAPPTTASASEADRIQSPKTVKDKATQAPTPQPEVASHDNSWMLWLLAVFASLGGIYWLMRKPVK